MKIRELMEAVSSTSSAESKLAKLGRVLMDKAVTTKDDELSNAMARLGDALTQYGTTFGARNPQELVKKAGMPMEMIQKMLAFAEKVLAKEGDPASKTPDPSQDERNIESSIYASESATAGATSAGNVAVGAIYPNKPAKAKKNKDGTVKNALDMSANLMTGGSIKR